jgi:hypothetical protein
VALDFVYFVSNLFVLIINPKNRPRMRDKKQGMKIWPREKKKRLREGLDLKVKKQII